jgi:hypothetical protein
VKLFINSVQESVIEEFVLNAYLLTVEEGLKEERRACFGKKLLDFLNVIFTDRLQSSKSLLVLGAATSPAEELGYACKISSLL